MPIARTTLPTPRATPPPPRDRVLRFAGCRRGACVEPRGFAVLFRLLVPDFARDLL
ncbi:hypothetical protein [Saccharopolyspora oryzae]|uniref:Uncharacterized protein n=1 Tax=Saccharopolyspora oryzae TaxID=2997343 RepID=A0ABT4URN9_9PSEU|nr:hypothetical protein [Saccharopolyspora oryzae]MDA3624383.1 hypothetical protein [Saccharopolyspora oryzae]